MPWCRHPGSKWQPGWLEQWPLIKSKCEALNGSLIYASNFSVGVNLFFELNKKLAALMNGAWWVYITMEEIHHTQKKDAPECTAITLAEQGFGIYSQEKKVGSMRCKYPNELSIISKRIDRRRAFMSINTVLQLTILRSFTPHITEPALPQVLCLLQNLLPAKKEFLQWKMF